MATQLENILDVVAFTLRDLGEGRWTNLLSSVQDHVFVNSLLDRHKVSFSSGYGLQWNLGVTPSNAAKMVPLGFGTPDAVNPVDSGKLAQINFKHATTNFVIDEREIIANNEPARILDIMKVGELTAMMALAELIETQVYGLPAATDDISMNGLLYWVVPNTTAGFNGGNPFGFSGGAAGVSSTTVPNWANYTDSYVDISRFDLIRKMRRAARFTKFQSPKMARQIPEYTGPPIREWLTTYAVMGRLEEQLENQNDNLGPDVARYDTQVVFRGNPVTWVPKWDTYMGSTNFSNATYASSGMLPMNPVVGMDWSSVQIAFMAGMYMKRFGPIRVPNQHNLIQVFTDLSMNMRISDRRRLSILTQ